MQFLLGADLLLLPQRTSRLVQVDVQPIENYWTPAIPFNVGNRDWYFEIKHSVLRLYPRFQDKATVTDGQLTASFTIRLFDRGSSYTILTDTAIDVIFKKCDQSYWKDLSDIKVPKEGFIVEVEFQDLKISSSDGKVPRSIWTTSSATTLLIQSQALKDISELLDKGIHTDVTITTSDKGKLKAHRAILAARSNVFDKKLTDMMISTRSRVVHLTDMTQKECWAFLKYLYGGLREQREIEEHVVALLKAAMKYELPNLKDVCQTSLIEGINATNVLTSLRAASEYQLRNLKKECKRYLFDFGKVLEIKGEVKELIRESMKEADDALGVELVEELIDRNSLTTCRAKLKVLTTL